MQSCWEFSALDVYGVELGYGSKFTNSNENFQKFLLFYNCDDTLKRQGGVFFATEKETGAEEAAHNNQAK